MLPRDSPVLRRSGPRGAARRSRLHYRLGGLGLDEIGHGRLARRWLRGGLSGAPKVTPSIRLALRDLLVSEVIVVHAGHESYPLPENVRGVAAARLDAELGR